MGSLPARVGRPWYAALYAQVLLGVVAGIVVGLVDPALGKSLKPLGDGFIKLIRMLIGPIVFCTVVHGIASVGDLRKLGRTGLKALVYFEVVSTIALVVGLVVVNVLKPGEGFHIDPATLDAGVGRGYAQRADSSGLVPFLLNIIPGTLPEAFVTGDLLQVLLVSGLVAVAITGMGPSGAVVLRAVDTGSQVLLGVLAVVVRVAPVGAFGAMAFTVGSHGLEALQKLAALMGGFYLTAAVFVLGVLGLMARVSGFSILRFLAYIADELLLVLGTSSSETALPGLMAKLRRLGCSSSTVGLVVPTGYSFNLDGTNIYMSMAAVFLAQATDTPLGLREQLALLLVAMVSSKGASGVTGAGFVTLAATLAIVPKVPVASLALLVGIDRFMSECRAITNLIGNGVAAVVISRWEGEMSAAQLREQLGRRG